MSYVLSPHVTQQRAATGLYLTGGRVQIDGAQV
jgi:hypothetical protein